MLDLIKSRTGNWPWLALCPVIIFILIALFGPLVIPHDPAAQDYDATLQGLSWNHWLGTDYLGRDIASRIVWGARVSLVAMVIVLVAALAIGVIIGSVAGYIGGKVELVLISLIDIALALPSLVIALALIGILGTGYWSMITALTLAWWANYARMSRAVVKAELQLPYIEATRTMGAGHLWHRGGRASSFQDPCRQAQPKAGRTARRLPAQSHHPRGQQARTGSAAPGIGRGASGAGLRRIHQVPL